VYGIKHRDLRRLSGAVGGAVAGAVLGVFTGNVGAGMVAGAAASAAAGAAIGGMTPRAPQGAAPAPAAASDLFCSLIPGANASSLPVTTGFTVLSAVGDQPPHHGVRRR